MDWSQLIASVSVEIGGGTGYWCDKCGHLYKTKPKICDKQISRHVLNKNKLIEEIHQLGEIDDDIVRKYIDDGEVSPQIEDIYISEKECKTEEEFMYEIVYDNLKDLILKRYHDHVYDEVSEKCDSTTFTHEQRRGREIDAHTSDTLAVVGLGNDTRVWNKLTPIKFAFVRDPPVEFTK